VFLSQNRSSFMFTAQGKRESLRIGGFTLLEIMLAWGVLGLMSLAIFRFVQANMTALRISSDTAADRFAVRRPARFLDIGMAKLKPPARQTHWRTV
jgi:hypothetical protein